MICIEWIGTVRPCGLVRAFPHVRRGIGGVPLILFTLGSRDRAARTGKTFDQSCPVRFHREDWEQGSSSLLFPVCVPSRLKHPPKQGEPIWKNTEYRTLTKSPVDFRYICWNEPNVECSDYGGDGPKRVAILRKIPYKM